LVFEYDFIASDMAVLKFSNECFVQGGALSFPSRTMLHTSSSMASLVTSNEIQSHQGWVGKANTIISTVSHKLKPRANGRNIVGQQLPTLLDVTCCVRLHTLLHVVGCCCAKFETGQTFQPTTPNIYFVPWSPKRRATMLDPFAQLFQHCWGHARSLRMVYKDLWVVSFPRCTAGSNIVVSCCVRLHAALC